MHFTVSDTRDIVLNEVIEEGEGTFTFRFRIPAGLSWDAGTNAHMQVPEISTLQDRGEKTWRRHMSLMSTPDEGYIGFTTRIREPRSLFKTSLGNLRPGERIQIYGLKNNFPIERDGRPLVMLSMGVGMATVRPLIREYLADPAGIPVLWSINVDRGDKKVYGDEMSALRAAGLKIEYRQGRSDYRSALDQVLELDNAIYYLVGSDEYLEETAHLLVEGGARKDQLRIDKKAHKVAAILDPLGSGSS